MTAAVSRNAELGATSFIAPSAGNAAGALAAYAAAAGIPVDRADAGRRAARSNQVEALVCGAHLDPGRGPDHATAGGSARELAALTGAFDVSTLKEPYRVEGKKTMGLELAEQLDWQLPDVILYPTGGGTGLVGMWKAFAELEAMGLIGPHAAPHGRRAGHRLRPDRARLRERRDRGAEPWQDATHARRRHPRPRRRRRPADPARRCATPAGPPSPSTRATSTGRSSSPARTGRRLRQPRDGRRARRRRRAARPRAGSAATNGSSPSTPGSAPSTRPRRCRPRPPSSTPTGYDVEAIAATLGRAEPPAGRVGAARNDLALQTFVVDGRRR